MNKNLRAGVIGTGIMGNNHIRVYSDTKGVDLVAVADTDKDKHGDLKERYAINPYSDYKKMISEEKLDVVSIAVPTSLHQEVAMNVMNKGINVLLEKPISLSLEEADKIIKCAKDNRVKLMIGHIERFNPAVLELKRRIDAGELGKVYKVDVNRVGPIPQRIMDAGVTTDLAVHDIDIMRFLTDSEPERIYAEVEQRIHSKKEDLLAGVIRFRNKTICYLNVNWLTPTRIRKMYITGERGMFVIDYMDQKLFFYENASQESIENRGELIREGNMTRFRIDKKEPLRNEIEHFIECVKENREPLVSGEDGKKAVEIALKLIESAGKKVIKNED